MFVGEKYVTKGIQERVPVFLQNMMWYMIESMNVTQKDYLQVFRLESTVIDGQEKLKITHSQEEPVYRNEEIINVDKTLNEKVYVIDDRTHVTMLLSEEY